MPRNILLLIADDLGRNTGCYGEQAIRTPNIDRIAKEGTLFDMAFTSTASCSPSRSVIYTGLHAHENGQYGLNHDYHHFMTFDHIETAPKLLGDLGYLTGIIGKVHVGPDYVYPWEVREALGTRNVAKVAERCNAFFQKAKSGERPFFLTVGFIDPHRDLTRGGFGNEEFEGVHDQLYDPKAVSVPFFLSDAPGVRQELSEYYRAIHRMDEGVGMIMNSLTRAGMMDDTLVLFVSDNGPPFVNSKTTLYDAGVRLPLLVKCPNSLPGISNPNMVSFVDILPTLLDWAGQAQVKGKRKGRSFLPILSQEKTMDDWNHVFGSHTFHEITNYYPTRFMRTRRYKYHRNIAWKLDFPFSVDLYGSLAWDDMRNSNPPMIGNRPLKNYVRRPAEELYDLDSDPREVDNIAQDPAHKSQLLECRQALEFWQKETDDPWLFRDGMSLISMQGHIDEGMEVPDRFDFDVDRPGSKG